MTTAPALFSDTGYVTVYTVDLPATGDLTLTGTITTVKAGLAKSRLAFSGQIAVFIGHVENKWGRNKKGPPTRRPQPAN